MTRRRPSAPARLGVVAALAALAISLAGCGGPPILANAPQAFPTPEVTPTRPIPPADPIPIVFPRDDGPHERLTEWWYYTGHLFTEEGRRFGFEAVVFRAQRSSVPTGWAAHLALTDEENGRFHYAQRSEIGPQVDHSPRTDGGEPTGFDLRIGGLSPALVAAGAPPAASPWHLSGSDGIDRIEASLAPEEATAAGASFGLTLDLETQRPPAQHDDDGFVEFGPAGTSYYYSRTRMTAVGTLELNGERLAVQGIGWFDHQWGDFVSVGGGWDWFAINLDDTTDITLSVVRDAAGEPVLLYGTLVEPEAAPVPLDASDFGVETLGSWTSPRTGHTWPSGWRVTVGGFVITLEPSVDDQELDTRATTSVVYWEGSQVVTATRGGTRIGGEAYVEITRYSD